MNDLPEYMWLSGDEDGGVTLVCDHPDHVPTDAEQMLGAWEFAYHSGHGEEYARGLPYFSSRHLNEFVKFTQQHANSHRERSQ